MYGIVAGIASLLQHINAMNQQQEHYRPLKCGCGRAGLWRHGCYPRKADRTSSTGESLNPIFIQRLYCPECKKTCSVLPECIPRYRWYLWDIQQAIFLLILNGKSLYAAAEEMMPSRRTAKRWLDRFTEKFLSHKNALCGYIPDLGRTENFSDFWRTCLEKISLAQAMRFCHAFGEIIP